ncbi:hypothetical protein O6072_08310 [Mycolicibacterium neoaurum]|uniref:hypothetical protein n=1 Tax=Mycolicibacterium neoaurum TaxID=1795 RepID=UPI00248B108B|nr:hypothetical protein [Mycolicibacterium neoaurum]WBP96157.1 hypothetical protein O7W24_08315 [Mycolicibacterium neoaurum]WBS09842.1 hypothetical protein O6072_08310 [Mycolicibacterium neoaurum]
MKEAIVFIVSLVAFSLAACQTEEPGHGVDRSDTPLKERSFQWTAAPEINLVSGPAVAIRAYIESRVDAQTMGSLDYTYPGFENAVQTPSPQSDSSPLTVGLIPDADRAPLTDPVFGNNRFHISRIDSDGDSRTALLCNFRYGLAHRLDNGAFRSVASQFRDDDGIDPMLVVLANHSDGADDLPDQAGPEPAPASDVFGDWKITGFVNGFGFSDSSIAEWPTLQQDNQTCIDQAPDDPSRRAFLTSGDHSRSDFPTSPPVPGWPKSG